jgi:predicted esterase
MSLDEVIDALKASVDKTVTLVFSDGEIVAANLILARPSQLGRVFAGW